MSEGEIKNLEHLKNDDSQKSIGNNGPSSIEEKYITNGFINSFKDKIIKNQESNHLNNGIKLNQKNIPKIRTRSENKIKKKLEDIPIQKDKRGKSIMKTIKKLDMKIINKKEPKNNATYSENKIFTISPIEMNEKSQILPNDKEPKKIRNYEKYIEEVKMLLNNEVIIKKIVDFEFFTKEDFQINKDKLPSKLPFIINIYNYINILNAFLFYSENDIPLFHDLLKKIGAKFSFIHRGTENIVDFGFLTNLSGNIHPYILSRGETGFEDSELRDFAQKFYQSNKQDLGHLFEGANKTYLLNQIQEKNYIELPKVIYYLNKNSVKKLFDKQIFSNPKDYSLKDTKPDGGSFSGFNEFDLCFKMKNDIKIDQNNNFNLVKLSDQDVIKQYDHQSNNKIEFKKDIIYFIEVKSNPSELASNKTIKDIKEKAETFIQFYNNNVYGVLKEENANNYENIFICNKNRDEVAKVSEGKNIKMLYSDKYISLNAISSLNTSIYNLNIKNESLKKDVELLKKENILQGNEIKDLNTFKQNQENNIKELNEQMGKKDNDIKALNETISKMQTQLTELKLNYKSLQTTNAELTTPKDNYLRLVNLLDNTAISKDLLILYAKKIFQNDNNFSTKNINFIAYLFNECGLEFSKFSDDCIILTNQIISGSISASLNLENEGLKLSLMDYFEKRIKDSHFPTYFKSLKDMIFGVQIENNHNNLKMYLTADNIENVITVIRNLLVMEEEYQKELIELKFSTTLLNIARNHYKEKQFLNIIEGKYEDISFMNGRIISCLNEMNLKIYDS